MRRGAFHERAGCFYTSNPSRVRAVRATPEASLCGALECFRKHSVKDLIAANEMMEQGCGRMQRDNGKQKIRHRSVRQEQLLGEIIISRYERRQA